MSRTAAYVALYRALEHRECGRPRLFADPFATRFLPLGYRLLLAAAWAPPVHRRLSAYADVRAPGARTSAIARTRIIDDLVRRFAAGTRKQLVLLGAGYDCRAHRLPELVDVAVFEVDAPDTQAAKRRALGDPMAMRVRYVPVDFVRDDLGSRLVAAGWDDAAPTLFVWEGVTNYLTDIAVRAVMRWIADRPDALLVFTYVHAGLLDGSVPFEDGERILGNVRRLGEPWRFGLLPDRVAPFLADLGLGLEADWGADDYRALYLPPGERGYGGYAFYRLAVAAARPARRPKNVASAIESPLL